ncbi:hypothetical protein [Nostoc sp.]|uniref:hypothetical protein n=1 Tax=Nostoc sp. TaxID=1180 RepID=UPI002FFB669A
MITQYLPSFIKDLKTLKSTPYYETIKTLAFEEITNIKKLQGYENAYCIGVSDYRIGIIFD